ncbi:alpha/beta fold hydrolase [Mucilaginibacter sp. PAMB04274]|uniref:alpha/beta fold hydrolase n=1 Tax=Mucilaginibacter sp. PAMB04274 TaxID=3138568 RepID=UPI0031F6F7BE
MKKLLLLSSLLLSLLPALAQTEPGNYRAALNKFMLYYNRNQADSIFLMFSPEVKKELPLEKNRQMLGQLQTQLGGIQKATFMSMSDNVATYKADFQKSSLAMKVSMNTAHQISGLLFDNLKPETQATTATNTNDPNTAETPLELKTLSGTIHGTLAMPKQVTGKVPVVLIIAAAGPTDRNGNKPKVNQTTNSYRLLATELAKNGIASLRYDKRLVGETISSTREAQLRFDDYVDDAVALITQLHDDPRFSKVVILGHSEGSLVGMLSTAGQPVSAFISVEGESMTADKIITEQLKSQPDYITKGFKTITDSLRKGKTYDQVDPALYSIARVSVQPYLMTWMRFDPTKEIKKVKVPVLLVQGANDVQVSVADAEKLKKAKSDAKLVIIPGMNYVLKDAPLAAPANIATYNQPNLPIKTELVGAVVDFVKALK